MRCDIDGNDLTVRRDEVDKRIAGGQTREAREALQRLWRAEPGPAAAGFAVARYEALRGRLALRPWRLALLRSFTVEPLVPLLRAEAFHAGIDLTVHVGQFNGWVQELLDPGSPLYAFAPDGVILAVHDAEPGPLRSALTSLRSQCDAHVVVHTRESALVPRLGVYDAAAAGGEWDTTQQLNASLRAVAREFRNVYVLDYEALVARHGREAWRDERKWVAARLPVSASHLLHLVREWMRFLHPMTGAVSKALIVDLDNTLWGGVIGEDGLAGIRLGGEDTGAAFQEVQRALLDLHERGILLGISSKNNPADALQVLREHPGMLLGERHFAARRIDWGDKAQHLREIATELNIGVDSLAFLDDNPVEREYVREQLPEVAVIDLPTDPFGYARALRDYPGFERLALSAEDRERPAYYAAERERREAEQACPTREDFLRSLEQEIEIAPLGPLTLARVAQLTQKTNQFNLTTRRYSEQQVASLAAAPHVEVFSIRVRDRFCDNGIVGVAILEHGAEETEIETLLLSCRVLGRAVETAFLAFLAQRARERGARRLAGWFLPTQKNRPASDFYDRHGFQSTQATEQGTRWSFDLAAPLTAPAWIRVAS